MCGIFFRASINKPDKPKCLGLPSPILNEDSILFDLDAEAIRPILHASLASQTILSSQDQRKLESLEELRQLQIQLNKYKNARNSDMVTQIEEQMAALSVEETTPPVEDRLSLIDVIIPEILARGPDFGRYQELLHGNNYLQLFSSVLSLRQPFTKQPIWGEDFILQFNGELYNEACLDSNDTLYIYEKLNSAFTSCACRKDAILSVVSQLDGEFAFVLTDLKDQKVYFGKDFVGKRSLLYSNNDNQVTISSVLPDHDDENIIECESDRIHIIDLTNNSITKVPYFELWEKTGIDHRISLTPLKAKTPIKDGGLETRTEELHEKLLKATLLRQQTIHPLHPSNDHLSLGVLFSGGLDCTVIAGLIAKNYVERGENAVIDLLTVGFENPRTGLGPKESPDRKLSERSWYELCKAYEGTSVRFRLVQVDVSYAEWLAHRKHALSLIYPCSTEMDLSIAIAFYFACRAQNCEALEIDSCLPNWTDFSKAVDSYVTRTANYTSQAKVLFSGLGADELFGGYSRHEHVFNEVQQTSEEAFIWECYEELSKSLVHDIKVIYERNLGRDDRVMASWGKELRYPFLDNSVIEFVINQIEPQCKVKFQWETIKTKKGEKVVKIYVRKHILRCLARTLGLTMAADEIKRAIQFGAKSAKLEVGKSKAKGTDVL